MTWNYRAVRRKYKTHEEVGIYSAYYDAEGRVEALSLVPAPVNSYSLEELKGELELMQEALQKPVLDYEDYTDAAS